MIERLRLGDDGGFSLVEMLIVLVILGLVMGALTQLFVAGIRTTQDQSNRFRSQQEARLALDGLRREIHCAAALTPATGFPDTSITITLGSYCASGSGQVTWCTTGPSTRYALWRIPGASCNTAAAGSVLKADYLTAPGWTGEVFTGLTTPTGQRAKLGVRIPVDVTPESTIGRYELQDDIVLRNGSR